MSSPSNEITGVDTSAVVRHDLSGDVWGGLAAMLVALPSAIAFGVTIFSPLGGALAAQGALAGILGATALGLIAPAVGGCARLITAPCAPAAAVLAALAMGFMQDGLAPEAALLLLSLIGVLTGGIQIVLGISGIGRLIKYIPYPVVSGYLSGVGLIIIGSQAPKLVGAPAGTSFLGILRMPLQWDWHSMLVGAVVIGSMLLTPRITQKVPAAIIALLAGVACYLGLGALDAQLLRTVDNPLLVGALATGNATLQETIRTHWHSLRGYHL